MPCNPVKRLLLALPAWGYRLLASIGAVSALAMLGLICADVFGRMLFARPLPGTIEIVSNWFMVGLVFLPLALIEKTMTHIRVETFTAGLDPSHVRVLDRCVAVLSALFIGVLGYAAIGPAVSSTRIGETAYATFVDLPVWPTRWAIVVACAIAAFAALGNAFRTEPQR